MKLKCLNHPDDEVIFLEGSQDIWNTYCGHPYPPHDIVIETGLMLYHDVVFEKGLRAAIMVGAVFCCTEEQAPDILKEMERDGVDDNYRWYALTEKCPPRSEI